MSSLKASRTWERTRRWKCIHTLLVATVVGVDTRRHEEENDEYGASSNTEVGAPKAREAKTKESAPKEAKTKESAPKEVKTKESIPKESTLQTQNHIP